MQPGCVLLLLAWRLGRAASEMLFGNDFWGFEGNDFCLMLDSTNRSRIGPPGAITEELLHCMGVFMCFLNRAS